VEEKMKERKKQILTQMCRWLIGASIAPIAANLIKEIITIGGSHIHSKIDIYPLDHHRVIRYLDKHYPEANKRFCTLKAIAYISPDKIYVSKYDKSHIIYIKSYQRKIDSDSFRTLISIGIIGNNPTKILNNINYELYNFDDSCLHVYYDFSGVFTIPEMPLDKIIMNSNDKQRLINTIQNWENNERWYKKNGIQHTLGILIYGEPGTGKTSLVKAISKLMNKKIITLYNSASRSNPCDTNGEGNIVLIEEIDMVFRSRTDHTDKNLSDKSRENLSYFLQFMDGLLSTDGMIFIATTNHVDRLDPALIRPGRFDIHIEMKYFTKEMAEEWCDKFDVDRDILKINKVQYPVQPAKLLEYALTHKIDC
jgi:hypothetical protein